MDYDEFRERYIWNLLGHDYYVQYHNFEISIFDDNEDVIMLNEIEELPNYLELK